jgi:hypothetical protein
MNAGLDASRSIVIPPDHGTAVNLGRQPGIWGGNQTRDIQSASQSIGIAQSSGAACVDPTHADLFLA